MQSGFIFVQILTQVYMIVLWGFCGENVNSFHLIGDWILPSFCAHYLLGIKKMHHKNLCILLAILQWYSALLSILIHFNWSAVENKRKSGLTQMAERISESLIHLYLSLIMTFWVNLT